MLQFIYVIESGTAEEDKFRLAAKHISMCIKKFRLSFENLNLQPWKTLAFYTETCGEYMKTLVLKASANESQNEYKVHLVPCFSSHIEKANKLFRKRFGTNGPGGLLHWIGQREDHVDGNASLIGPAKWHTQVEAFGLTNLAAVLRSPADMVKA